MSHIGHALEAHKRPLARSVQRVCRHFYLLPLCSQCLRASLFAFFIHWHVLSAFLFLCFCLVGARKLPKTKKSVKSHWCVPFTATFSKRRKIGASWSERCDEQGCPCWTSRLCAFSTFCSYECEFLAMLMCSCSIHRSCLLLLTNSRWRPYRVECTGSLLTSEVKRLRARLVLGSGTAWEYLRVLSAFDFHSFVLHMRDAKPSWFISVERS